MLLVGGWEFDDYDFDVNPFNASLFWNSFTCYQWGFTAAWDLSESSALSLQAACSPLNSALSYAAQWDGTYGPYSMKWSALGYPYHSGCDKIWNVVFCLGNRLELGDVTLTLDYFNRFGDPDCLVPDIKGHTVNGSVLFAASDEWELGCKVSYNSTNAPLANNLDGKSFIIAGATASWCPADDIRIQANAGYSDGLGFALLGVTYNFDINIF